VYQPPPPHTHTHTHTHTQTLESLIEELDGLMNERDQQVDSALSNVAQRLARAIKTRCAAAMAAAAPALEQADISETKKKPSIYVCMYVCMYVYMYVYIYI